MAPGSTRFSPRPPFDPARFCELAESPALGEAETQRLAATWDRWTERLTACAVRTGGGTRLLAWLDKAVEDEIDGCWTAEPRTSFLLHVLALNLLMAATAQLVPQITQHGCAPVPAPDPELAAVSDRFGLVWTSETTLERRYALVTPMPWQGGCAICLLQNSCPKLRTPSESA